MKFNSTVALTLVLLVMMLGAGSVSALFGYRMGDEALKGVTQPDVSPSKKLAGKQKPKTDPKKLKILLREEEILKKVREHIQRSTQNLQKKKQQKEQKQSFVESESSGEGDRKKNAGAIAASNTEAKLPMKGQDGGIALEVTKVTQEDGALLLEVNLKNDGSKSARFLYSFLDVKDDRGRTLSAITDGLPGELPANGKNFAGIVKIPTALLEDTQKLSLTLTDYPDQKLQISIPEIPVAR